MRYDLSTPGGRLRFFRHDREFTQETLGARAGVDQTSISYYEKGAKVPRRRVREALALALGVQPHVIWSPDDLDDLDEDAAA